MAAIQATRVANFMTKKLLSQMVIAIDEAAKGPGGVVAAGDYLVAHLPEHCVIQNAYVFTTVAGTGAVTLGTSEGGSEILATGDVATPGESGAPAAKQYTGSGLEVYLGTTADTGAVYYAVIEYLELGVNTGSLTRV